MHARWFLPVLLMSAACLVAQAPPTPCPADRPVDEIIAQIHQQKSKKHARNKNPLPDSICIFGWCKQAPKRPPKSPEPPEPAAQPESGSSSSASARPSGYNSCDEAMDRALEAAHDIDVGDTYFEEKNYRAAMMRYQDAAQQKADDAAILVRLGRAYEKTNQPEKALEQYRAAEKLTGPEKWTEEAKSSAARLQKIDNK